MKQQTDTFKMIIEKKQHSSHAIQHEKSTQNKLISNIHKQEHYHNRGNR